MRRCRCNLTNPDSQHSTSSDSSFSVATHLRAAGSILVSREILRYCIVLTSPLLVTVVTAKAIMLLDVIFPLGLATFDIYLGVLASISFVNVVVFLLAVAGILVVGKISLAKIRKQRFVMRGIGLFSLMVLIAALLNHNYGAYDIALVRWSVKHLLVLFDAFRWDLLFAFSFVLFSLVAISRWPTGKSAVRVRWLITGIQVPLILASSLEFALYLKTGVTGSGQLFMYAITHGTDILPIVGSEMDLVVCTVIVVPILAAFLMGAIAEPHSSMPKDGAVTRGELRVGRVVWPIVLLLAFAPKLNANAHYFQFEQNIQFTIGSAIVTVPFIESDASNTLLAESPQEMLFDTSRLQLVASARSTKSNVILVILESAGANSTSVNETGPDNTPFLKAFADQSTVVEQMYVVVPRTLAAWISVLQGVYPAASNVTMRWGDKLERADGEVASLPNLLRPFGYQSAFFTPTHLNFENERQLISNIGFDEIVSKRDYESDEFEIVNYFGWEDRIMTQPILDWVDEQAAASLPMFLTIMTNVGHHDYKPPRSWPVRSYGSPLGKQHNDYLNSLAYVDSFLNDLFASLDDRGVLDDSLVVIVGDHGESFGEHGKNHHMAVMYEESLRVPAIIYSSSAESRGESIPGIWQLPDIFPTIIDVLGYEMRNGAVAGRSVFESAPKNRRVYFAGALDNSYLGLREGNLKYIYYFGRRPTEVFDIEADREERYDLGGEIDAATIRAIEQDLLAWYQSTKYSLLGDLQ